MVSDKLRLRSTVINLGRLYNLEVLHIPNEHHRINQFTKKLTKFLTMSIGFVIITILRNMRKHGL